jgi:streptomycin 6-kinase
MAGLEPALPLGTVRRLREHYGDDIRGWLLEAESTVAQVARRHGLRVVGYHDAGWASVIAVGIDRSGRFRVLKAVPEADRFRRELAALRHWAGDGASRLVSADEDAQTLVLEQVGGGPGGAGRPADHLRQVVTALPRLHRRPIPAQTVLPTLVDHYQHTVLPRIERRAALFGHVVGLPRVVAALDLGQSLCAAQRERTVLHSDLYAENVLFGDHREVVFIDPHATVGPAAFDWAFWAVYYQATTGFDHRLRMCAQHAPVVLTDVLSWIVTLAVDGALYYRETGDPRHQAMLEVLESPKLGPVLGRK